MEFKSLLRTMNILPKKKWHVRTKENIARVRRDEKEAAEREQQRLERAIAAENERRLEALRAQAAKRNADMEPFALRGPSDASISTSTGHVNLFQELELAERQNFGQGNKEYQEEKRKEQAELDSKMGIQKYFAEGTNELNKVQEWYTKITRPLLKDEVKPKSSISIDPPSVDARINKEKGERLKEISASESSSDSEGKKKKKKKSKKKKRKRRHNSSDSSDNDDREQEIEKRNKLAALREERIRRERYERHRTQQLLNPTKAVAPLKQKYNSMFNPDLCTKRPDKRDQRSTDL